jgi:flagella basal body P-ring formation protein FlgA
MNRTAHIVLFFLMSPLLTVAVAAADEAIDIRLLSETTVTSDMITLDQIAEISGQPESLGSSIAALELGAAPKPGRSTFIHPGRVENLLKDKGYTSDQFLLSAIGPVKVLRGYEDLTAKRVTHAVRTFILKSAPWERDQIKIRSVKYNQRYRLPSGKLDLLVSAPKHTDWIGAIAFRVDVFVKGRRVQRLSVPAHIEVWSDVIVAAKPLARRQPIGHDDIKIQRMNLSRTPKNIIVRKDQVIGNRTTSAIAMNAILCTDDIEMPPAVSRGDVIQLLAESPLLRVTTKGVAKDKGAVGDRIRVLNLRSKKMIYARIVDPFTARVSF